MKKDALLTRIEKSRMELEKIVDRLSEAQLEDTGVGFWPAKIHLAHLAAWEAGVAALLQKQPRYAGMRLDEATYLQGETAINAAIYEQYRDKPAAEILAFFHEAHWRLMAGLAQLTEEDLQRPYSDYDATEDTDKPIINKVIGNTYGHYEEHMPFLTQIAGVEGG